MKEKRFIKKLIRENKISLVKSSQEICESYNQKSENSLRAAKVLLEQKLLEETTTMSYYAMFHKTTALFRLIGIKCENHTANIILIKEIFNLENKDILYAKKERVDKQYYTDFIITSKDAKDSIEKAEEYIETLDMFIDKLTEDKRNNLKKKFKETYF